MRIAPVLVALMLIAARSLADETAPAETGAEIPGPAILEPADVDLDSPAAAPSDTADPGADTASSFGETFAPRPRQDAHIELNGPERLHMRVGETAAVYFFASGDTEEGLEWRVSTRAPAYASMSGAGSGAVLRIGTERSAEAAIVPAVVTVTSGAAEASETMIIFVSFRSDIDLDGDVDFDDLTAFSLRYGSIVTPVTAACDLDGSGTIDASDLTVIEREYGSYLSPWE